MQVESVSDTCAALQASVCTHPAAAQPTPLPSVSTGQHVLIYMVQKTIEFDCRPDSKLDRLDRHPCPPCPGPKKKDTPGFKPEQQQQLPPLVSENHLDGLVAQHSVTARPTAVPCQGRGNPLTLFQAHGVCFCC